ncbi:hypothetical protein EGH24_07055 [Halonotius terrestris]|uniref:Uncharacterized protein n=1 Tax=Halonotius terrestris TaxID=2487750 RepID=A0A8J8PC99_9EURY|nr:hypothetical protein [Halonotius terrestris]TQQ80909.1 hypothetical protein EGH24_07055 [Halonotius terrestris]
MIYFIAMVLALVLLIFIIISIYALALEARTERKQNPNETQTLQVDCPYCGYENENGILNKHVFELQDGDDRVFAYKMTCKACNSDYYRKGTFWGADTDSWTRKTPPGDGSPVINE